MKKIFVLIISSWMILSFSQAYSQQKGSVVILPAVSLWVRTANIIPDLTPKSADVDRFVFQPDSVVQKIIDNSPLIKLSQLYDDLLQGESPGIDKYL